MSAPNGWRGAALSAVTVGELYDIARRAQQAGEWTPGDQAWCALLRERLTPGGTWAAVALVCRELGARPLDEPLEVAS